MADDLPTDYDVIVLGTGMVECIFAAACARIGKSVLHLDRNGYYGGDWASFNLDQLQKFLKGEENERESHATNVDIKEGESLLTCSSLKTIRNVSETIHIKLSSGLTKKVENPPEEVSIEKSETEDKCEDNPGADNTLGPSNEIKALDSIDQVSSTKSEKSESYGVNESENNDINKKEDHPGVDNTLGSSNEIKAPDSIDGASSSKSEKSESSGVNKSENKDINEKEEPAVDLCWEDVFKQYRKFNLDISPKLLFSRGELVELLISSNVAKYAEYKCLTRVLTYEDNKLVQVPCSRSDVFSTKHISVIDKRMLMKLMNFMLECDLDAEENVELKSQPFGEFLKKRKLSENICHYVINAIAMVPANASTEEGLRAAKKFLRSLGRFGNTPFLWPMYGSGEIPQCFCRLCAVFGGIYFLRRCAESIIINADKLCCGIISEGQRFNCKVLLLDSSYAPSEYIPEDIKDNKISRAILITKDSVIPTTKEQLSLLRIPPTKSHKVVNVLELPPGSMVCPEGMNVVYLTSESLHETSREDLNETVDKFFDSRSTGEPSEKPRLIWSAFFNLIDTTKCDLNSKTPANIFIASNSGVYLDSDHSVIEARKLFSEAFPESEFLPRAPDPDEIILGGDDSEPSVSKEEGGGIAENSFEDNGKSEDNEKSVIKTEEGSPSNVDTGTSADMEDVHVTVAEDNSKPTDESSDKIVTGE